MLSVVIRRWAAWAPGVERGEDWERWCRAPAALGCEGSPDLRFLPPMLRRRCSRLSRLMLHVAYAACGIAEIGELPTVFASRYGEMATTVSLLERLAKQEPLTATGFSHSVHNTQAGLFSSAAKNRRMGSAVAAGAETFPCAFVETLAMLQRDASGAALLVVGDEPLPAVLGAFEGEPRAAYALALVVEWAGGGPCVRFDRAPHGAVAAHPLWPQAIEFLRWLRSDEPALTLGADRRAWTWTRA